MIALVDSVIKLLNNWGLNDSLLLLNFPFSIYYYQFLFTLSSMYSLMGTMTALRPVIVYFILLISSPVPPPLPHPHFICMEVSMHRERGSQKKGAGMFVISLRGVNFRFWSHLSFSKQNTITFSCKGLFWGCTRRNKEVMYFKFILITRFM